MQIKIFTINASSDDAAEDEMNRFLRGHRTIEVRQQYDETRGYWSFVVSYIEGSVPSKSLGSQSYEKVDYREILPANVFEIFARLREQRKILAKEESVPAYAIFTDKELAQISGLEEITIENMITINGINKGRVEKYGERMLQAYLKQLKP